jgi:hypothetical protein
MKEVFRGKIHCHSRHVCPASLLGVSYGYCQRVLVAELQMIRTHGDEKQNRKDRSA